MGGTNDKRRRQGSGNRHADGRVDDIEYFSYRLDDGPDEENIEENRRRNTIIFESQLGQLRYNSFANLVPPSPWLQLSE